MKRHRNKKEFVSSLLKYMLAYHTICKYAKMCAFHAIHRPLYSSHGCDFVNNWILITKRVRLIFSIFLLFTFRHTFSTIGGSMQEFIVRLHCKNFKRTFELVLMPIRPIVKVTSIYCREIWLISDDFCKNLR